MTPYRYRPLKKNEIRLITLPSVASGDCSIGIQATAISRGKTTNFEALSYAWGSQEDLKSIKLRSSDPPLSFLKSQERRVFRAHIQSHNESGTPPALIFSLNVTRNLEEALQYLRLPDKPRVLWVDAICINQQDLAEKSRQVAQMASIYRSATRVVAWLGAGNNLTSVGMTALSHLTSRIEVDLARHTIIPISDQGSESADLIVTLPSDESIRSGVSAVFSSPWFKRLWIWQEIHARRETAIVLCGWESIAWTDFCKAVYCIISEIRNAGVDDRHWYAADPINLLITLCWQLDSYDLPGLLESTEEAICSDPRDRIYALLGLADEIKAWPQLQIRPDYTKSVKDVYMEVVLEHIKFTHTLRLLQHCELMQSAAEMPSWTRDWSRPGLRQCFLYGHASIGSEAKTAFQGGSVLVATGVVSSTVHTVDKSSALFRHRPQEDFDFFREILKLLNTNDQGDNGYLEGFLRVVCCDGFSDAYHPERADLVDIRELKDSIRQWQCEIDGLPANDSGQMPRQKSVVVPLNRRWDSLFRTQFFAYTANRALVQTDSGQV